MIVQSGGVHHLALRVASPERSAAFYSGLLGLDELRRQTDDRGHLCAIWLDLGGGQGGPILMLERALRGGGASVGSGHVLALAIDDLAEAVISLEVAGIAIDDRTDYTLFVRDPDGHRVGLSVFDRHRLRE
ncbi:MAG TPA: lactoylglutathione lyase [Nannocystis exedens]|nr:lactoylglutathione lyase [Nannocystis exedens]